MAIIIDFPKAGLKRPTPQDNSGLMIDAQKQDKLKEQKERARQNLLKAASKLNW